MQENPILCQDKEKVAVLLADEWKMKDQNQDVNMGSDKSQLQPQRVVRASHIWSLDDGRAPKRALTPYMLFVKERKYELMAENPSMAFGKMMQLVAERWKTLDPKEREYFNMRSDEDKVRHQREMEVWNNHCMQNPGATQWKKQRKHHNHSQVIY